MNVRNDVIITTGSYFQDNVFHKNISFIFLTKLVCFALEPKIAEIFWALGINIWGVYDNISLGSYWNMENIAWIK